MTSLALRLFAPLVQSCRATWLVCGVLLSAACPTAAHAVLWNATDYGFGAVNVGGLTDNYGQFVNASLIVNNNAGGRGTATYLKDGWFLTARHVITTNDYNVLAPPNQIAINVYGQDYFGDQIVDFGGADVALIHVGGHTSGQITTLPGVEKRQFAGAGNGLAQIGGFGIWGPFGSTPSGAIRFNRAFNNPFVDGPFLIINSDLKPRLVDDGYVLGTQGSGDSGGPMWEANVPTDQSLDLYDWSLTGVTQTGGGTELGPPAGSGSGGAYGFLQHYAATTHSTVYPHAVLTWNANPGAGATAVDGSGTWNLTTTSFTDGTNFAFNGPERTEQAIFGAGNGAAGTVTLGATIPVTDVIFNAAGSGNYTIAGSPGASLRIRPHSRFTTNVDATISANITGGAPGALRGFGGFPVFPKLIKNGAATLTLTGNTSLDAGVAFYARAGTTVIDTGGVFNSGLYTAIGAYENENATLTIKGAGTYNGVGQDFNLGDLGGDGVVNVQDSATLNVGQLYIGKGHRRTVSNGTQPYSAPGTGTVNQTGGVVTASSFVSLGTNNGHSSGTYNLSGGALRTGSVRGGDGQSTFNFNGGTLTATASSDAFMQGLSGVNVNAGGAIVDSGGHNITIDNALLHAGAGIDGGLTKQGAGTLTLSGASTYNGSTAVNAGGVVVDGATGFGQTTVAGGASLSGRGQVRGDLLAAAGASLSVGSNRPLSTASLSVTNGDFETGIFPPGEAQVDQWFDANTVGGFSDFWNTAQHEHNLSPMADAGVLLGDGGGTALGVGGRWVYQQIGAKVDGASYTLSFDYGNTNDVISDRTVRVRAEVYQGAYTGADGDESTDIAGAGLTLITSLDSPGTMRTGEGNYASFTKVLDLSAANTSEPLWLRLSNLPGTGSIDNGSFVVVDNVVVQGTLPANAFDTLTVGGNLDLAAGASLALDLGESGHDGVQVAGTATLDGQLLLTLADGYTPELNDAFTVLTAAGIANSLTLGGEAGSLFSLAASTTTELILTAVSGLEGDYNNDGAVDAIDYAVWRENMGNDAGTLFNDSQSVTIGQPQFDAWLANYGAVITAPSSGFTPAPEPAAGMLLLLSLAAASVLYPRSNGGGLQRSGDVRRQTPMRN